MTETPDPRALAELLQAAVTDAMEVVDRIARSSGSVRFELKVVPDDGDPFVLLGEDQDITYVAGRMAARKKARLMDAIAQTTALKAALVALLDP